MTQQQSVISDVDSLIDKLAAKLAVPASHLWGVLVRQAQITAVTQWAWVAIWLLLAAFAYVGVKKCRAIQDDESRAGVRVLACLALLVSTMVAAGLAIQAVKMRLNPEYYAVQDVLKAVKPKQ